MVDRFLKHPFIRLIALCALVVTGTWSVSYYLYVAPRDDEIARLKSRLETLSSDFESQVDFSPPSPVVLPEIGVNSGDSITTSDGFCIIHIISTTEDRASIRVTLGSTSPQSFKFVKIGSRVTVRKDNTIYYVDLLRARGNIVDLTVSKHVGS